MVKWVCSIFSVFSQNIIFTDSKTAAYCICMFVLMLTGNCKTSMDVSFPCLVCFYAQESVEVFFLSHCVPYKSVTKVTNEY